MIIVEHLAEIFCHNEKQRIAILNQRNEMKSVRCPLFHLQDYEEKHLSDLWRLLIFNPYLNLCMQLFRVIKMIKYNNENKFNIILFAELKTETPKKKKRIKT